MSKLQELYNIADIHAQRINLALERLKHATPFTKEKVLAFGENEIVYTDLLINRFAKLQDYLANKVIGEFLNNKGHTNIDSITVIDKVNLLEKYGYIESYELWNDLRDLRNHITHEYPDMPELTADYLNQALVLVPKLLNLLEVLKENS